MSAIIILTIGPVQSYISQARRTQDLWQGSRILSYLAGVGVYKAHEVAGQESVVYPSLKAKDPVDPYGSIPNRIVLLWQGDEDGARDCAGAMKKAIEDAWKDVSRNTFDYFVENLDENERPEVWRVWENQEKHWLECYWVVTPYDENNHAASINAANAALGARKLLRNFPQIDESGRKCSITGEHEALRGKGGYVEFWDARKAEQRNLALLGKHERLSAISTVKRFAHEEEAENGGWQPINPELEIKHRYPSTSSVAAVPFRYDVLKALDGRLPDTSSLTADERRTVEIRREKLRQTLQRYISTLVTLFKKPKDLFFNKRGDYNEEIFPYMVVKQIEGEENPNCISSKTLNDELVRQFRSIDGDFLFEDTLINKTIEEYSGQPPSDRQMGEVREALSELLKAASALNIPRSLPYVVILSMDGDHMGKMLGVLDKGQHERFSETLANFARTDVPRIVEQAHLGRVVYAGGDDVLALLPVRDALEVADKLRSEFAKAVTAAHITDYEGQPVTITASTGLAYVHHTHNLQDAVRAANDAQKMAKEGYGRDALAVEFLRRSGEPRSMGHKWHMNGASTFEHVNHLTTAFGDGLSRNLPYDLAQMAYSMGDHVPQDAVNSELERVIRRRLSIEDKKERNKRAEELRDKVMALKADYKWQNAQSWLELARFIAQTTEAEGD